MVAVVAKPSTPLGTSALGVTRLLASSLGGVKTTTSTATPTKTTSSTASTTTSTASTTPPASGATTTVKAAASSSGKDPSISGYVYIDSNKDGQKDAGDYAVGGAPVTLNSLTDPSLSWTAITGSNGSYSFSSIPAGVYTVSVPVFSDLISGSPSLGFFIDGGGNVYTPGGAGIPNSDFGTPVSGGKVDSIADINLQSGFAALDYDFSELGVQTDMVSKRLFLASTVDTPTYWEDTSRPYPRDRRTGDSRPVARRRGVRRTAYGNAAAPGEGGWRGTRVVRASPWDALAQAHGGDRYSGGGHARQTSARWRNY